MPPTKRVLFLRILLLRNGYPFLFPEKSVDKISRVRPVVSGVSRLCPASLLAEFARHQICDRLHRLLRVRPIGAHHQLGAALGRQHHHAHYALAVHLEIVAHHRDLALELRRGLHQFRRGARVQAVLVHDPNGAFHDHLAIEMRISTASTTSAARHPSTRAGRRMRSAASTIAKSAASGNAIVQSCDGISNPRRPITRAMANGSASPARNSTARARYCGPRCSKGLPSDAATRRPPRHPVFTPQARSATCPALYRPRKRITMTNGDARKPNASSATSEQNGSHPAHTSRSPRLPNGPHIAVRKRSICAA